MKKGIRRFLMALLCVYLLIVSVFAKELVPGGNVIGLELQNKQVVVAGFDEKQGEAAKRAGLVRVYIPRENMLERFETCGVEVMMLDRIQQAVEKLLLPADILEPAEETKTSSLLPLAASGTPR